MSETKQASVSAGTRAVLHELMAAFEAFKGANDARLDEIVKKASGDVLLEDKVVRIDQAVASAQARPDRAISKDRRPQIGGEPAETVSAPEPRSPRCWRGRSVWARGGCRNAAPSRTGRRKGRRVGKAYSPLGFGPKRFSPF